VLPNRCIQNGQPMTDTQGNILHAHGGWILSYQGYYYWYGEDRRENYYVSCYRSEDLLNWEFRGHILTQDSATAPAETEADLSLSRVTDGVKNKVNIERPKVLYHAPSGKFILWAHYENGADYRNARCCIASCDTPDGQFVYHGSFNPCGEMSRDCTVWQEPDGTAYFISAANENRDLHIYRLTESYLGIAEQVNSLWNGQLREAPAVFRKDGKYWMLSSYCTGWRPNQGCFASGEAFDKAWSPLALFGDETTFDSQPSFVLQVGEQYLYFGDRWCWLDNENLSLEDAPKAKLDAYCQSGYVILPIRFTEKGTPYIEWQPTFSGLN